MSASREKKSRQALAGTDYVDPKVIREEEQRQAEKRSNRLYLTIAVKNVYEHHSWIKSIVKALLISLNYLLICLMIFCIIFIITTIVVVATEIS